MGHADQKDSVERLSARIRLRLLGILNGTEPIDTPEKQRLKKILDGFKAYMPVVTVPEIIVSGPVRLPEHENDNFYMDRCS